MLKKEKIFIFLTASGLRFYSRRPEFNTSVNFVNGELKHQEVTDIKKYSLMLAPVLQKLPPADLILLIADEFIYNKNMSSTLQAEFVDEKESFLTMIPFDEAKIAHRHVVASNNSKVIAVNKDLYEPILAIAKQEKKKIKYIVPISLIHKDEKSEPTYELLEKNYSQGLFKKYDLSSAKNGIPRAVKITKHDELNNEDIDNPISTRLKAEFIILLVALGVLFYTVFHQKKAANVIVLNNVVTRAPTQAPVATSTPQPTIAYKQLKELKTQILNGSVLAGQAAKLKKALTEMGLAEVEAGNHETDDVEDIMLTVSNKVSPDDEALLVNEIETVFPELSINKSATTAANFDVVIVIGNKLTQ